jgi:DNA-binding winged helix-turn-helix (wHTH) protein
MTPIEHNHSESGARRLRFDRYVLDLERGCLLLDDSEIVLRPKTLAVLRFLVDNPGRLVSKEDLFAAVWPNIAVTDDVLVQSVGELRRALANDGQRLIKTIPRRGYRFESVVSAESSANPTPVGDGTATASMDDGILAFRMPNAQKALISIFRGDWRRALAVGLGLAVLIFATVLLTDRSGRDLGADTRSPKTEEAGAKPAIAILPLVNQSDDASREYFADGLTQDVIHALGRFRGLTVMSWNAVLPYKTKPNSPGEIAS